MKDHTPQSIVNGSDEMGGGEVLMGNGASYLASLSHEELRLLRVHVYKVQMKSFPNRHMTEREADRIIESIGPRVKELMIKRVIDDKMESDLWQAPR